MDSVLCALTFGAYLANLFDKKLVTGTGALSDTTRENAGSCRRTRTRELAFHGHEHEPATTRICLSETKTTL